MPHAAAPPAETSTEQHTSHTRHPHVSSAALLRPLCRLLLRRGAALPTSLPAASGHCCRDLGGHLPCVARLFLHRGPCMARVPRPHKAPYCGKERRCGGACAQASPLSGLTAQSRPTPGESAGDLRAPRCALSPTGGERGEVTDLPSARTASSTPLLPNVCLFCSISRSEALFAPWSPSSECAKGRAAAGILGSVSLLFRTFVGLRSSE